MFTAHNAIRHTERIENAAIVAAIYGDDTPSYYAVPANEAMDHAVAFKNAGAYAEVLTEHDVRRLIDQHTWIGIKVASIGSVAAWGRAIVQSR